MFAAAGIVVTEIKTPISAPDFDVLRLSMPAAPAHAATKNVKKSGWEMMLERPWFTSVKSSFRSPDDLNASVATYAAVIASGKPTASATAERSASAPRLWTAATQNPASGPNSGPTTIAPTIRIAERSEERRV